MEKSKEKIYQDLIEDDRFVSWVKSKRQLHKEYMDSWKKEHPHDLDILKKAAETVSVLGFQGAQLDSSFVSREWEKTNVRLNKNRRKEVGKLWYLTIQRAAAILFLPFLLFSGYLFYQSYTLRMENQLIADAQTGIMHTVEAVMGSKVSVCLPDSSTVLLNSGSSLKYPARFAEHQREVELTGEAYFEIEKSKTPFTVKNAGPSVKVYGTKFNLDAYDETHVALALVEGKVSVQHQGNEYFIKPGQVALYNNNSEKLSIKDAQLEEYTSWKEGYYLFRKKPLGLILQKLKYRYNCKFILEDKELGAYRYNGKIKDVGLEQLLYLLSLTGPINYSIEKSNSLQGVEEVIVRIKKKD